MKKLLLMLAVVSLSAGAVAQEADPAEKYSVSTNSFWSNWFVQADVTWNAFYNQEPVLVAPFHKFPGGSYYTGLGASLAIGKWFTPALGLRTKINAWAIGSKEECGLGKDNYWAANEQVLFNLSNLFCGYSETRVWDLIPFVGAGINRNMSRNHYSTQLSAGLLNTFRLTDRLALNAELGWNSWEASNSGLGLKDRFQQFTLEVGVTLNLGATRWHKTPDVEAITALSQGQIDALNAQLADAQSENARLRDMLANQPKPTAATTTTVTRTLSSPVSVFFNLGQSKVASKKDLQNVADLAALAKETGAKLLVTGYADSKTGSARYNQTLSQKRAETVARELVRLGISRDDIQTVAAGGVDTLSPFNYNRRATVEIK